MSVRIAELEAENERLRAALDTVHNILADGRGLSPDTYQTRCEAALAILQEVVE